MTPIRARFRFDGRVQGVNFRQFIRNLSGPLQVGGFARNQPDGSVVAELEGEPEAIDRLVRALHEDHPLARIDRIDRQEMPTEGSRPPVSVY